MDDAREDAVKGDPAAEAAATFDATGGEPDEQGGVDFGMPSSTELLGADLLPEGLLRPAGGAGLRPRARTRRVRTDGGHDRADGAPGPVGGVGVGGLGLPDLPERQLLGAEHVRVADQRPPGGRRAYPRAPELQDRLGGGVVLVRVDFQLGAAMRSPALLVLAVFLAATALIGERDASRRDQFRALMLWLAGCLGLFRWILSRR
ncbi:hypothetical protein PVAP13_1NG333100 [Panicum virgatum]|uniref:Uncharacterized protein n=1 Tax=Panicum virgatum TaxID=38727 RepID=A0A8T0X2I9_PANVG|nr:hypothetical protein PVAP13_1NG333100 [Panicum virgatum]